MLNNLFQRSVPRLDIELPYDEEFKTDPDTVEDVVLPLQMIEGNWVDVLVEEEGEIDGKPEDGGTLRAIGYVRMKDGWGTNFGTDTVWQSLDCVSDEQVRPGRIVKDVVNKDHGYDSIGGGFGSIDCEAGGANCPDYEDAEHTRGSDKEQSSAPNSVDEETSAGRNNDICDLEDPVDEKLRG